MNELVSYIAFGSVVLIFVITEIIKYRHFKNVKPKKGTYIFNKPSWMEFLSFFSQLAWMSVFGWGTFITYQMGETTSAIILGIVTLVGFYIAFKEIRDRNDELKINENQLIIRKGKKLTEFSLDDVSDIKLLIDKSHRNIEMEMLIQIITKSGESDADIRIDNLLKYKKKMIEVFPEYLDPKGITFEVNYTKFNS